MKTILITFVLNIAMAIILEGQAVTEYSYKLDNGINIKSERCWNQVWVQQGFSALAATDKTPLTVDIRTLGDLISGSSFKLLSSGKELKLQGVSPGKYDLRMSFSLSGSPGNLSFIIGNVEIKPKMKTTVSVTLYDYQFTITESKSALNGLAAYETEINRCKTNTIQDIYFGVPSFYVKGTRDKVATPAETTSNIKGKMKPETYDLLITIGVANQTQKIWLENFSMKPDTKYLIKTNLNAGGITYTGPLDVKMMHLYPAGTAAKQSGTPSPLKNLETIAYDKAKITNCCSPGSYDVLLSYGNKYEWKKNIAVSTGQKTEIK